jgi:hypothetical protein
VKGECGAAAPNSAAVADDDVRAFRRYGQMRDPAPMRSAPIVALYVAAMAAIIVGVDLAFFRHHGWERLAANVGIVLVFAALYFRFVRRSGS